MRIKKPISCLDCIYHSEDDGTGLHECIHPNKRKINKKGGINGRERIRKKRVL